MIEDLFLHCIMQLYQFYAADILLTDGMQGNSIVTKQYCMTSKLIFGVKFPLLSDQSFCCERDSGKKILDFNWKLVFLDLTPKMRTRWIHLSPVVSAECIWNVTPKDIFSES